MTLKFERIGAVETRRSVHITHAVIELFDVKVLVNGRRSISEQFSKICADNGLNVVNCFEHWFGPGETVVVVLSESHIGVHTWPELRYLHIDMVICSTNFDVDDFAETVGIAFGAGDKVVTRVIR